MIDIINSALNVPLMLTSVIANTVVLVAILSTPSLRSSSTIVFLCSLALSDLLVGFIVQPLSIAKELVNHVDISLLKRATNIFATFLGGVSLFTSTAISVDRYLALRHHMRYPILVTTKRAIYTSTSLWIFCILLSFIDFRNKTTYFWGIAASILICVLISSFSYGRIFSFVLKHRLQIKSQQQNAESFNAEHHVQMKRLVKSVIITFLFFICMIACYTPVLISSVLDAVSSEPISRSWILADTLAYMNSSINPFLYCWRLRDLRRAFIKTLRKLSSCH